MKKLVTNQKLSFLIPFFILLVILIFLPFSWLRGGLTSIPLDTDTGRDLFQLSNIFLHRVVWLGPSLSAGFPASPIYYYLFFPVLFLARGNANALIYTNVAITLIALGFLGVMSIRKWRIFGLLPVVVIGLSPWFNHLALHPGNGYTYSLWLILALTGYWFELPLFYPTAFLALAVAFHPAAALFIPLFFYEWWRRGHSFVELCLSAIVFILPWTPIIVFEIITKAFLTRSFLAHPGGGISAGIGYGNLMNLVNQSGLPFVVTILLLFTAVLSAKKRLIRWILIISSAIIFISLFKPFPPHYLLGLLTGLWFVVVISLTDSSRGRGILTIVIIFLTISIIFSPPAPVAKRSITKMQGLVDSLIRTGKLDKNKAIAPVAILSSDNKVPQADDYRFFLRMKGYRVLDVDNYNQAETLILFVEEPNFPWEAWSSWETDRFGKKTEEFRTTIDGVNVIVFEKRTDRPGGK